MQQVIPVFFTIDDGYVPFLSVALYSLARHTSGDRRYVAWCMHQNVSEENQRRLKALETEQLSIRFCPIDERTRMITDRKENLLRCDYFTLTIYFRLFLADMFPQYDKGIYIDSDVIIESDIAELFDTPLGVEEIIGACPDVSIREIPPFVKYVEEAVGTGSVETYINSGVLLLNMKYMREKDFSGHFLRLMNTYHFDSVAPDQDYINAICHDRIHFLQPEWDVMPSDHSQHGDPKLIHFNLFDKPWCYDGIPYADRFWHYVSGCGYEEEIRAYKEGYTDEQKEKDQQALNRMLEQALAILSSDLTFQKALERGEQIRL